MPIDRTIQLAGVELPRIGLGTNRLTDTPENVAFLRAAVDAGLGHVDTAYSYTGGASERTIGAALSPAPDGVVVATKGGIGGPGRGAPDVLHGEIAESRRRLQVETLQLWYLHRVDPQTPLEVSLRAVAEHVERGEIAHVGLSEVSVEQIEAARQIVPVAAVQNHYNLAERKHEDVVDFCEQEGIVFVPFFPLRANPPAAVAEIAGRHGATPTQVVLAWLLRRSPAMLPIPGTLSLEHLRENLAALDLELDDAEAAAIG
jgi:aryl-alcohol dehydrogenase-like predicted oxidoreductase